MDVEILDPVLSFEFVSGRWDGVGCGAVEALVSCLLGQRFSFLLRRWRPGVLPAMWYVDRRRCGLVEAEGASPGHEGIEGIEEERR